MSGTGSMSWKPTSTDKQQRWSTTSPARYVEARDKVDDEIAAEKEKNKGLVDKAQRRRRRRGEDDYAAEGMFMGMLSRAADAFTRILDDPLGFITQPHNAVQNGFMNFAGGHPHPPQEGTDRLADRRTRRGRHRAAGDVRRQGHSQARRVTARADLGEPQGTDHEDGAVDRDGYRRRRDRRSRSSRSSPPRVSAVSGTGSRTSSATLRR